MPRNPRAGPVYRSANPNTRRSRRSTTTGVISSLLSADELTELLGVAPCALLDVRWELATGARRDLYEQGHIPGAVFVDLDSALAGPPGRAAAIRFRPPTPFECRDARRRGRLGAAPWSSTTRRHRWRPPAPGGCCATSATATCECSTVASRPGLARASRSRQAQAPETARGDFTASPGAMPVLDAAAASEAGARRRAARRPRGGAVPRRIRADRPGRRPHPGCAQPADVDERERGPASFWRPGALREAFAGSGVTSGRRSALTAARGSAPTHEVLALELAGYPGAALYPGSWSEWVVRSVAARVA